MSETIKLEKEAQPKVEKKELSDTKPVEKIVRVKSRTVEELANVPANKMTDAEKNTYIKYLREQNMLKSNKVVEYQSIANSLNEKAINIENNANAAVSAYQARIQLMKDMILTNTKAILAMEDVRI